MKLNKEKLLQSEFGSNLIECVIAWDYYLIKKTKLELGCYMDFGRIREGLSWCQAQWEVYQAVLKYFYDIEYHFSRTNEYFEICTEDESDWLLKKERIIES